MNKHQIYLNMAKEAAKMSKCPRRGVASLLVNKDGRVKGYGYNGNIEGYENLCGGDSCLRDTANIKSGTQLDIGCIHSESNMIINATREDLVGGTVYVSAEPCLLCAKLLAQCKIKNLYYIPGEYPVGGAQFLVDHGVEVFTTIEGKEMELTPSEAWIA